MKRTTVVLFLLSGLMVGCQPITINMPEQKPFSLAGTREVILAKEIATPVRFAWDAPTQDTAGNPLDQEVCNYELWVNGAIYAATSPLCTVADAIGLQVAKVRASCDGQTWSDWSDICAKDFPALSISSSGVRWKAEIPLRYSLLWTSSLMEPWQIARTVTGTGQVETYPLIGPQGFFKLEGRL